jgi:hypothetical protein
VNPFPGGDGFAELAAEALRKKLDPMADGHHENIPLERNLEESLANDLVAPSNNEPGREALRHGWDENVAGMVTQELTNDLVRNALPKRKLR